MTDGAEIGIFGGSGFYELLTGAEELAVDTPYGPPSDRIVVGELAGRSVAFLPRHGRDHAIPPHRINYRANVAAMAQLGVTRLIAPCAVGSLRADLAPGDFVVLDQFVDRTRARADTFYDGAHDDPGLDAQVVHVSLADPYCTQLRDVTIAELVTARRAHQAHGTVVVIQGPRFSTRAESRWFAAAGWDVVGMTQYPEVPLARERAMCVLGVAMVTDHDAGVAPVGTTQPSPDVAPVTHRAVLEVVRDNVAHLEALLHQVVAGLPPERTCRCGHALDDAHG